MKKNNYNFRSRICVLLSLIGCVLVSSLSVGCGNGISGFDTSYEGEIAQPEYPQMAQYPEEKDYRTLLSLDEDAYYEAYRACILDRREQVNQLEGYEHSLDAFFETTIPAFLSNTEGENRVYSPVNVYMALSMMAELTEGQILDLIGTADIETLRGQAAAVWNACYCDDGKVKSVLANSLWLNAAISFRESTMDTLASQYYASSYQGIPGSEEMNQALRDWINGQTGDLLKDSVKDLGLSPETVLAVASTIYFQDKWEEEFTESRTKEEIFHGSQGDVICDYMYQSKETSYYWGEVFGAVSLSFEGGSQMWLVLPDEGVTVNEMLDGTEKAEEWLNLILHTNEWTDSKRLKVNLSLPRFDVASTVDLKEDLKSLGVTDIFDSSVSNFTPMTDQADSMSVSSVRHGVRVVIDEEGCTAAAYTVMPVDGAAMPLEEEIDFVLDRPFLFVITGSAGLPLFVGVVNQP